MLSHNLNKNKCMYLEKHWNIMKPGINVQTEIWVSLILLQVQSLKIST